jgi:phosphatidylglycerophosphate synthase
MFVWEENCNLPAIAFTVDLLTHVVVYHFILFSLEIVTTGSPHSVLSWVQLHRNRTYGGFVDAVCDKAFVIPCWISLLHNVPGSHYLKIFQYVALLCLILAETASGCIRFQAYFTAGGVPAPKVVGFDFSTSAVKADHIGKAKQTFEMVGTALFCLPLTRYGGLLCLLLAVPLAYESVRRKVKRRVVYVNGGNVKSFDNKTLKFWMQAKAMGSKLIVGIPGKNVKEMVLNACASSSVDVVIAEAPAKADLMFLEKQGIDFCICAPGEVARFVTDEVVNANRCLAIGEDGIARPLKAKVDHKE